MSGRTQKELMECGLPKWSQMIVTGEKVTEEQALEIIRRTDAFFSCGCGNNNLFKDKVNKICGVPVVQFGRQLTASQFQKSMNEMRAWKKKWGYIELMYIPNDWISCSYIYGPNGWCHPDGNIGYHFNIGKHPSVEEVLKEFRKVAEAFPFLKIEATLMSGEDCEDNTRKVVSIIVRDGKAKLVDPEVTNVHAGKEFEAFKNYRKLNTEDYANYENAIPMSIIKKWGDNFKGGLSE